MRGLGRLVARRAELRPVADTGKGNGTEMEPLDWSSLSVSSCLSLQLARVAHWPVGGSRRRAWSQRRSKRRRGGLRANGRPAGEVRKRSRGASLALAASKSGVVRSAQCAV